MLSNNKFLGKCWYGGHPWIRLAMESESMCWCTKVGAFLYPFTCARAVIATPVAMLGGAEEGKIQDCQGSTQARGRRAKGQDGFHPATPLPGRPT